MLLGQELKFKNKLCNLKLGTFFSALPGLGASALSGRAAQKLASALSLWPVTVASGRVGLLSIPQNYGFIFKPARDFGEKLQKKLGATHFIKPRICVNL